MKTRDKRKKEGNRQPQAGADWVEPVNLGLPANFLPDKASFTEKAWEIIAQTPEVRWEKVAALQEAVRKNAYKIDARQIANFLILHMLVERGEKATRLNS
jgi:hypothetical protein